MNLKKIGQCLFIAGGISLGTYATVQTISDIKKKHQEEIYVDLIDKKLDIIKARLEEKNPPRYNESQRIVDSLETLMCNLKNENSYLKELTTTSKHYSYTQETGQNHLHGNTTYTHQDQTTTEILNALSGFDTKILYPDTTKEIVGEQDSVMYKTIRAMHTKYQNPKIELAEKFDSEKARADYSCMSNTTRLKKNNGSGQKDTFTQRFYIRSWINEEAHAYQLQRDGLPLYKLRSNTDDLILKELKGDPDDVYSIPGTLEYEAHGVIADTLEEEFIALYTSLCDTNNIDHLYKILALNAGFFERYYDLQEVQKYYEKIVARDGEIKNTLTSQNISWAYLALQYQDQRKISKDEKDFEMAKICYIYSAKASSGGMEYFSLSRLYVAKGDIENAIKYYELFSPGSAAWEYIALMFMEKNKYTETLEIYEAMAAKGDAYAIFCLIELYDPEGTNNFSHYDKNFPYKDKETKKCREQKYIEAKMK